MSLTREEAVIVMVRDGVEIQSNLNKGTNYGLWSYTNGSFYKENKLNNVGNMAAIGYEIYTPPPKMVTKWLWSYDGVQLAKFAITAAELVGFYQGYELGKLKRLEWSATEFPCQE